MFVRGDADDLVLSPDAKSLAAAARNFGQPGLAPFAEQVIALKTQLRGRRVLAEVVPFRYARPDQRPVGLHSFFLVRVFEGNGDSLTPRLDLRAHVSRPDPVRQTAPRAGRSVDR